MVLSDYQLTRMMLEAAAPILAESCASETEWGYRCRDGHVHFCHGGEPHARGVAARGDDGPVVSRTVTYGPWEDAPEDSRDHR
jgi:hypothetical protein